MVYTQHLEDFYVRCQKNPSSFLNLWTLWVFRTTFNLFLAILQPSVWSNESLKITSYIPWFKGFTRGYTQGYLAKMCRHEISISENSRRRSHGSRASFRTVFSCIRWKSAYKSPFMDQKEGKGIFINFMSILRMRIDRAEVPWTELRLKTKFHSTSPFANWISRLLSNLDILKKITHTGIRKALNLAKTISINRRHHDLEFLNLAGALKLKRL